MTPKRRLHHKSKQPAQAETAATSDWQQHNGLVANNDQRLGRAIGTLERLLIITRVTTNSYEALAFVIGANSFVRYPRLSEEAFTEDFFVGTLTSTLVGVALGLAIRLLWHV